MKKTLVVVGMFLAVVSVRGDDLAQQVVGRWAKQGDTGQTLAFYGAGIGMDSAFFRYSFPETNQVVIAHSSESSVTYTISVAGSELHLTDAESHETVYDAVDGITNVCLRNLSQIEGAKALFVMEHPDTPFSFGDLYPAYVTEVPACPDGGVYQVNDPARHPLCGLHGDLLEE